jgi:hypothetical protein
VAVNQSLIRIVDGQQASRSGATVDAAHLMATACLKRGWHSEETQSNYKKKEGNGRSIQSNALLQQCRDDAKIETRRGVKTSIDTPPAGNER